MLSREYLRERTDDYRNALKNRGASVDLERFLELDAERRRTITQVEALKAQRNAASQEIAQLKKTKQDASAQIEAMKRVGDEIKQLDERLAGIEDELRNLELYFPNVPDATVPVGPDDSANRVERTWGEKPQFDFEPKPHWDVGEALGILDFERATKITGTRFAVLNGMGAQLSRAIMNFMLDEHGKRGYTEVLTPFMVNADSLRGTGNLPKFEQDLFKLTDRDYYLIPTAEVPVTNLYRDEILEASMLPMGFVAYSKCFRREAGSAGKDTRGVLRTHEFDKVELVRYATPESSADQLELLTRHAETMLERLGLPYRRKLLAAGDTGFSSAMTYDLEAWAPGVGAWLEVSSCSNLTEYQARRANIRYRPAKGEKPRFVHTLNGSGLAFPRTLACILEHYQNADGSVTVPDVLRPYLGTDTLLLR
jgi:seryl-tRNA synthetase